MKYFSLVSGWSLAVGFAFLVSVSSLIQADPTDDFSLTLSRNSEASEAYSLMSEQRVAQIFADRLDLFPRSEAPKLARHLISLCRTYRFDPAFVLSLIQVESAFHVKATSPVGAIGLMQLMPSTAVRVVKGLNSEIASPEMAFLSQRLKKVDRRELDDPFVNLTIGVAYLAWLRDHYHGLSPYFLVAAYNVGPARIDELRSRRHFRPKETKKYYEAIRRGVPGFRFYQSGRTGSPFGV